jgi:hypothetical protein
MKGEIVEIYHRTGLISVRLEDGVVYEVGECYFPVEAKIFIGSTVTLRDDVPLWKSGKLVKR